MLTDHQEIVRRMKEKIKSYQIMEEEYQKLQTLYAATVK